MEENELLSHKQRYIGITENGGGNATQKELMDFTVAEST